LGPEASPAGAGLDAVGVAIVICAEQLANNKTSIKYHER
jgi:hypothetical protein